MLPPRKPHEQEKACALPPASARRSGLPFPNRLTGRASSSAQNAIAESAGLCYSQCYMLPSCEGRRERGKLGRIHMHYLFGVDYYPEHWPKERWATDAKMMREMGVTIVRMAEFSWSKWEPREGEFHFEDLDEAIEILGREGIDCILGTPTAAPPKWIIDRNPEIQPMDAEGRRYFFGGRHHDCQSNPVYREHIRRFVTAFARHYAQNPHVVGWQVDNELGNSHGNLCYCPSCEKRFRQWLKQKYQTIERLNQCWGTAFWSQGYTSFDQITAPKMTTSGHNPSQQLDWKRFCSDLVLEFHQFQADILRQAAPGKFITHNLMGFSDKLDYHRLGEQLDFASHDQYPGGHFHARHDVYRADFHAAELDLVRSVKKKPFWIMEQQSGITGWEILGRTPRPGQLGLWAMQCVAHGADTILFFRWRSCLMGTEQYWHGILPHNGEPGRYYREIKAFMDQAGPWMEEMQGAMPPKEAAILFSYEQDYAFAIQPHHPDLRYTQHLMTYYGALHRKHIPTDFVRENDDWSGYKVLIAPLQFLMTPELSAKLHAYVAGGGRLVLDFRCGVKDAHNLAISTDTLPCLVHDLCGIRVTEYDCLRDAVGEVVWNGEAYESYLWNDIIELDTATMLAAYGKEFYQGSPAITCNAYGQGKTYYVGTQMSPALADRMIEEVTAGIAPLADTPWGVEVTQREKNGKRYLFVLNHTGTEQPISLPASWQPMDGKDVSALPPYAAKVYRRA